MSGGVDSSVAASLLLEQGHEVVGVFMRHGEASPVACELDVHSDNSSERGTTVPRGQTNRSAGLAGLSSPAQDRDHDLPVLNHRSDHKRGCCTASDAEDARRVADRLDVPFFALDLAGEFREIMDYFAEEYLAGRTPNPCVMCNRWIKFGKLFHYADSIGAEFLATGHYARLADRDGEPALLRGIDSNKDQSYALFGVERSLLSRMLLPIGTFTKPEIRAAAERIGLRVAEKRDSQEICFVASGKHGDFIRSRHGGDRAGEIVTVAGDVVGTHRGVEDFTIGQRKGLGVALGEPYFVVSIDADSRRVTIGPEETLYADGLEASDVNWLIDPPATGFRCEAKIRYNGPAAAATAEPTEEGFRLTFDDPRKGVAPGQAAVLYDGDRVLGGGWIDRAFRRER
jgi:tRNA-specific 2-thiouridylase